MSLGRILRAALVPLAVVTMLAGQAVLDGASAAGTLAVSKASLSGGRLTVEGSGAATGFIAARSTTSVAGTRAGLDGRFEDPGDAASRPRTARVVLQDNKSAMLTVTLAAARPAAPSASPAPPSGNVA